MCCCHLRAHDDMTNAHVVVTLSCWSGYQMYQLQSAAVPSVSSLSCHRAVRSLGPLLAVPVASSIHASRQLILALIDVLVWTCCSELTNVPVAHLV